jgi:hypothetical protein
MQESIVGEGLCAVEIYGCFLRVDPKVTVLVCRSVGGLHRKGEKERRRTLEQRLQLQDMTSTSVRGFVFTVYVTAPQWQFPL